MPAPWDLHASVSRRSFIIGGSSAAAVAWLVACGGDDSSSDASIDATASTGAAAGSTPAVAGELRTQLGWLTTVTYAGWYLADEQGFFAAEGRKSELLSGGPDLTGGTEAIVRGGQADLGIGTMTSVVAANQKGADLVVIGAQLQRSAGGLLSLPDNPIREISDVLGKKLGIDEGSERRINALLDRAGLPHDYDVVPALGDPQAVVDGVVDAMAVFVTAQPLVLKARGIDCVAVTYAELGYSDYGNLVFTTRAALDEAFDALTGYLRAVIKGCELNISDPAAGAALTVDRYGIDNGLELGQQTDENEATNQLAKSPDTDVHGLFWLDLEKIQNEQFPLLEATGLTGVPKATTFVTTSVQEAAMGGATNLLGS